MHSIIAHTLQYHSPPRLYEAHGRFVGCAVAALFSPSPEVLYLVRREIRENRLAQSRCGQLTRNPDKSVTGTGLDGTKTSFFAPTSALLFFTLVVRRSPIVRGNFLSRREYILRKMSKRRSRQKAVTLKICSFPIPYYIRKPWQRDMDRRGPSRLRRLFHQGADNGLLLHFRRVNGSDASACIG